MEEVLKLKVEQNPIVKECLLNTKDYMIAECCVDEDTDWGVDNNNQGENNVKIRGLFGLGASDCMNASASEGKSAEYYSFKDGELTNLRFNLTYEDLFIELNEKYFFLINFKYTNENELREYWDFGSPFLKKYSFICDRDNNIIGFYNNKTNQKNDFPYFMIIIIIFGVVIISLLVYILYYILNKKEKKKAHELSEDVTNEKLI